MSDALPYRPDIDGLRAIAVSSVVIYHAFPSLLPGGFVGVDIFFVISGMLITGILLREMDAGTFSVWTFYKRRVQRLFPALVVVLLATYLIGWLFLYAREFEQLGKHLAASTFFGANFVFWSESGYFDAAAETKPLLHLWSLGIEEQFYIVWPLVLALTHRHSKWLFSVAVVLFGASLAACVFTTLRDQPSAFFLPHTRFWELLAGAILAILSRSGLRTLGKSTQTAIASAGVALIIVAVIVTEQSSFPGAWALLPVLGATLLLATGGSFVAKALSYGPLVYLGRISYPLYLWHWPILSYLFIFEAGSASIEQRIAAVATALILAALTYRFIEESFRRPQTKRPRVWMPMAAIVCLAIVGIATWSYSGLSWRLERYERIAAAIGTWAFPGNLRPGEFQGEKYYSSEGSGGSAVLFVGNSVVSQYGPRIEQLASSGSREAIFFTRHGCLVMPRSVLAAAPDCDTYMQEAEELAMSNPEVGTVVIGGQWYGGITADGEWLFENSAGDAKPIRPGSDGFRMAFNELEKLVQRMTLSGKSVVLLFPTPFGPELDPRNIVSRKLARLPAYLLGSSVGSDGLSLPQFQADHTLVREALIKVAHQTGAKIIEPIDSLCDEYSCQALSSDGQAIYMDAGHLQPEYVREHVHFLDCVLTTFRPCA